MYKVLLSSFSSIFYNEWKLDQNRTDYNMVFCRDFEDSINIFKLKKAIRRFISDYVILNSHVKEME